MSRSRGNVQALHPIRFCRYCARPLTRGRHPSGRLEKLKEFEDRKCCSVHCSRAQKRLDFAQRTYTAAAKHLADEVRKRDTVKVLVRQW